MVSKTANIPIFNQQTLKEQLYFRATDFFRPPKRILNITDKIEPKEHLSALFPLADIITTDRLSPPESPVDMILWHDIHDVKNSLSFFKTIYRWLAPQGLFLFSTFGPSSQIDQPGLDMHHWGDALQRARFESVVMDRQNIICQRKSIIPWLIREKNPQNETAPSALELIIGHGLSAHQGRSGIPTKTITQPSPT